MASWYWDFYQELDGFGEPNCGTGSYLNESGNVFSQTAHNNLYGGGGPNNYTTTYYPNILSTPYQNEYSYTSPSLYVPSLYDYYYGQPGSFTRSHYVATNGKSPLSLSSRVSVLNKYSRSGALLGSLQFGAHGNNKVVGVVEVSPYYLVIVRILDRVGDPDIVTLERHPVPTYVGQSSPFTTSFTGVSYPDDKDYTQMFHMKRYNTVDTFSIGLETVNEAHYGYPNFNHIGDSPAYFGNLILESYDGSVPSSWTDEKTTVGTNEWGYATINHKIMTSNVSVVGGNIVQDSRVLLPGAFEATNSRTQFALGFNYSIPDICNMFGEYYFYNGTSYQLVNPIREWDTGNCTMFAHLSATVGAGNLNVYRCWVNGGEIYAISRNWSKTSDDYLMWKMFYDGGSVIPPSGGIGTVSVLPTGDGTSYKNNNKITRGCYIKTGK